MQTRRGCDEMGTYLRRVVDYLRGPACSAEVAKAPEDRGGAAATAEETADWDAWFLFDRPADGDRTPLRRYVDDHPD
ncbi:MAG: hypothetical protein HYU66_23085, partial [Armatimonadetes bacterium]|nr:hypothetical protein [Armatimonadota bacterium]